MNKQDKRKVMFALSEMKLTDDDALKFIYKLAQGQLYKSPVAFNQFCTDCAIFYTSSPRILMDKFNEMTNDEVQQWENQFIERAENLALDVSMR